MRPRLAVPVAAALAAVLLPGCGEAIGDPPAPDASEREVLKDAAEMLPARPATSAGADAPPRGVNALPRGRDAPD